MNASKPFVDYYKILQVDPNCNARSLETAYHTLAKTYHPDHTDRPDVARLTEVIDAYKALKNPEDRVKYDLLYANTTGFIFTQYEEDDFNDERAAISDAEVHEKFLQFLYKKRRENARDAGVGRYYVQQELNCSDEHFEFHIWYLKSKGLIESTEQGELAITIEGVDHVISLSRSIIKEKLMISETHQPRNQSST